MSALALAVATLVACSSSSSHIYVDAGTTTSTRDETTTSTQPASTALSRLVVGGAELNSSTYSGGSFRLTNESPEGQQIASLRIDLSTGVLPDIVFDPDGTAGDTLGRGFTVNGNPGSGPVDHSFGGEHDLGFDVLTATFVDFGPGKTLAFCIDIDPTTIRAAEPPGPGEAGSVSGLELTGATVTVAYDDGTTQTGRLFRSPDSLGQSEVRLTGSPGAQPSLEVVDDQTIRVTAPPGATVRLVALGTALFTSGLPGGGFDVDDLEANSIVAVAEQTVAVGPGGAAEVPLTLASTDPATDADRFVAAVVDPRGPGIGPLSNVLTLRRR